MSESSIRRNINRGMGMGGRRMNARCKSERINV
jgi:hypothetical protein